MNKAIVPAILTESVADLQAKVDLGASFCERIGVDIIDGEFADNLTVLPEDLQGINWHNLQREAQLMVTEPVDYLGLLHTAGFSRVYGHIERMGNMQEFADECKHLMLQLGWALDLYTPISSIPAELLARSEGILLMSTKAGFSNQKYVDISEKVRMLRSKGYQGDIVVDGGMNAHTVPTLVRFGANEFCVTSAIWDSPDPALSYRELAAILTP